MTSYIRTRTEFAVNSFTAENQTAPSVATFSDGSFVVVWGTLDTTQDGKGSAIKAQLFDASGSKVGREFLVNSFASGSQFTASVTTLDNGNFVVTWATSGAEPMDGSDGISARLFDRYGAPLGGEFQVDTSGSSSLFTPVVTALDNGGFVISWADWNGFDVKARIYDATGWPAGGEFRLNANTGATQDSADITVLANGGFVAAWRTTDTAADGSGDALKAQIFDASGARVGAEFLVNSQKVDSQYDPSITALAGGGFVITWATRDSAQDGNSGAVKGQIFDASGAKVGGEFLVNTHAADIQREAVVTGTPDGGFVVAWTDYSSTQDGSGFAIKAQAFDAAGAKVGAEMLVNTLTSGSQFLPDIATLADGRVIVTWTSTTGDIGGYAVRAQILGTEPADPLPNTSPIIISPWGTTGSLTVDERVTAVTTIVASDDGEPNDLRYSITGGDDSALFTINALTGALAFIAAPDHVEGGDNLYHVVVAASDGQLSGTQSIYVTVRHVNQVAIVSDGGGDFAMVSIDENQTGVTIVSAVDDDGAPLTYSLEAWDDAAFFTIDPQTGELSFTVAPDYEYPEDLDGDGVYVVYVTASDGNVSDMQRIDIVVGDVDEGVEGAVVIISDGGGGHAVVEAAENGTAVTSVAATGAGAITYEIVGGDDAWQFVIDPETGALEFMYPPDFDYSNDSDFDNVYEVIVRASDGLTFDEQHLSVVLQNVDEAPIIYSYWGSYGGTVSLTMAENGWQVGTVAAYDPDSWYEPITYSIAGGADAALFAVDPDTGALTFVYQLRPDFEAPTDADGDNVYDVVVAATSGTLSSTQTFAVTIANENEGVYIVSDGGGTSAAIAMNEGESHVTTVVGYDPDGTVPTYSIMGGPDAARFTIDSVTGALSFVDAPDYEAPADEAGDNFYTVEVAASDGYYTSWQTIQILIGNVNEGLDIVSYGSADIVYLDSAENGLAAAQPAAVDRDGDPVTYSITGGADAALFTVDAATGALSFVGAPDFENPADADGDNVYSVVVTASDGEYSDWQAFGLIVGDVAEKVTITSDGGGSTAEVSVGENGGDVTTVVAEDDDGTFPTFAIVGGADASRFTIDAQTGALRFVAAPDHEAPGDADGDNVYDVVVRATDGSFFDDQAIAVGVTNVDEGLEIVSHGGGDAVLLSRAENGSAVGQVAAVDQDGDSVTYLIAGGADSGLFVVDPVTGALSFAESPDFEAPADADGDNVYEVEVAAISGGFTDTQAFAVTIANANEAPAITSDGGGASAAISVGENGRDVTTVAAADPDGNAATYSIVGGADAARFTIDPQTGLLQFVAAPDHELPGDADGDNVYSVIVQASDGEYLDSQALSVTVANLRDGAIVTGTTGGDSISGTSTNPALRTTHSEDTVSGRDGHDTILGLGGDDILNGDSGNDVLNGGAGADRLTGGLGKDQFVYNSVSDSTPGARDVITDFSRSQSDRISLSAIDANSVVGGNQAFTFIGSAAFSGVAGQLRYATSGGVTLVSGDVNGDGLADFQIELSAPITPVASDFVL